MAAEQQDTGKIETLAKTLTDQTELIAEGYQILASKINELINEGSFIGAYATSLEEGVHNIKATVQTFQTYANKVASKLYNRASDIIELEFASKELTAMITDADPLHYSASPAFASKYTIEWTVS